MSLTHPNYGPSDIYKFGICAETVKLEIIADYTISSGAAQAILLSHTFDPFCLIYPMKIENELF